MLVFGEPHDTLEARSWVGLAEQDINLDRFLTVRETLEYHGGYFGMAKDEIEDRAEEMIQAFGLSSSATCARPSCRAASAAGCCSRARSCTGRAW